LLPGSLLYLPTPVNQRVEARIRLDERTDRLGRRHRLSFEANGRQVEAGDRRPEGETGRHHPTPAAPRNPLSHVTSVRA
jgi:hypothetical protein